MTMNPHDHDGVHGETFSDPGTQTPADLRDLEALLSSAGRAERDDAPAGLEARVFESSFRVLNEGPVVGSIGDAQREGHGPIPFPADGANSRTRSGGSRWLSPMKIAALIGLAGVLGVAYLASRSAPKIGGQPGPIAHGAGAPIAPTPTEGAAPGMTDNAGDDWLAISLFSDEFDQQLTALSDDADGLWEKLETTDGLDPWSDGAAAGAAGGAM